MTLSDRIEKIVDVFFWVALPFVIIWDAWKYFTNKKK